MTPFAVHAQGWNGLAATQEFAALAERLDDWLARSPGTLVVRYDSRYVRRIDLPSGTVYLKHIRALTDAGLDGREWLSWCKWVFRPSRALATWRISRRLLEAGFRCPEPLLAVRRRRRLYPTDVFISAAIPYPDLWQDASLPPAELARFLAAELARFHDAGFAHGDCILRNLCRDTAASRLVFLDNDRTWQPPALLRRHYQRRNLAQLAYSLLRRYDGQPEAARLFLDAYAASPGAAPCAPQAILDQALRRLQKKHPPKA